MQNHFSEEQTHKTVKPRQLRSEQNKCYYEKKKAEALGKTLVKQDDLTAKAIRLYQQRKEQHKRYLARKKAQRNIALNRPLPIIFKPMDKAVEWYRHKDNR